MQDTPQAEAGRILDLAKQQMQRQTEAAFLAHRSRFDLPEPRLRRYAVQDFFCADPREQVVRCHLILLGRLPDSEELSSILTMVAAGFRLTLLIRQMRRSEEGMIRPVRIRGLWLAGLAERYRGAPLVSAIAGKLGLLPPLPDTRGYHGLSAGSNSAGDDTTQ